MLPIKLHPSAKTNLSAVKNYEPGKPLEELEREYGIKNAVKMASNENAFGPSPKALRAIRNRLPSIHRYPDGGCFYLRDKLSKKLKVSPESLVFGNGSDEVLVMAIRAFAGPGTEVIIADTTFLISVIAAQVENSRVVKIPMKNYRYDLNGMKAKITGRTRLIFVANPDNPVGTYIAERDLLSFFRSVPRDVMVVLDEAYYEFASIRKDYPDSLKILKTHRNVIITRTFSKAYGLSGLRIGYGIAQKPVAAALNKVREPFNVNLLAQAAAAAALDDTAHLRKTLEMVNVGRRFLTRELKNLNVNCVDTVTNFILADLGRPARPVYEALLRKGVIVRAMGAWGLGNFIRVTIGRMDENKRFIRALREITNTGEMQ